MSGFSVCFDSDICRTSQSCGYRDRLGWQKSTREACALLLSTWRIPLPSQAFAAPQISGPPETVQHKNLPIRGRLTMESRLDQDRRTENFRCIYHDTATVCRPLSLDRAPPNQVHKLRHLCPFPNRGSQDLPYHRLLWQP